MRDILSKLSEQLMYALDYIPLTEYNVYMRKKQKDDIAHEY